MFRNAVRNRSYLLNETRHALTQLTQLRLVQLVTFGKIMRTSNVTLKNRTRLHQRHQFSIAELKQRGTQLLHPFSLIRKMRFDSI